MTEAQEQTFFHELYRDRPDVQMILIWLERLYRDKDVSALTHLWLLMGAMLDGIERDELSEGDVALSERDESDEDAAGGESLADAPSGGNGSGAGGGSKKRGGWVELKYINGYGPYAYRRWRESGRLRSEYIGRVASGS